MMKYFLIILGSIIILSSCKKEQRSNYPEYYKVYNQVLQLEKENKIEKALNLFKNAEKLVEFIPVQHLLKARELAVSVKNCDLAQTYFQKAVNNGFEYEEFNYASKSCPSVNNSSVVAIEFDEEYRQIVKSIFAADQAIRNGTITDEEQKADALNIEKLLSLIEEKGYPSSKIIGSKTAGNAFIILLHFDADIGNKRLKPILEKAYHKGMLDPSGYAWIIDRRRNWGPEKLDPYFYQLPTEKYFELTAEEIAIIDKRRDSIGLKPLSEMNITKTESGGISIQL